MATEDRHSGFALDSSQRAVLDAAEGEDSLLIEGIPGSGKTTILIAALQRLLERNQDSAWAPALVLTPDRRRASELESLVGPEVLGQVSAPGGHRLIRSVNSYAYLVVSQWLVEREISRPRPKLTGGADEDVWFAQWIEKHKSQWLAHLPEAVLDSSTFRMELRNLLARAGESAIGPAELRSLARQSDMPLWAIAADIYQEYAGVSTQVFSADTLHFDAARIQIIAANILDRWSVRAVEEKVFAQLPVPSWVFLDDLQDCTFATAYLLRSLISAGAKLFVTTCPELATASYRGGKANLGQNLKKTVNLKVYELIQPHRFGANIAQVVGAVTDWIRPEPPVEDKSTLQPTIPVNLFSSEGNKESYIADNLRQYRYLKNIPWDEQAVIVRSAQEIEPIRRGLRRKGVPLAPSRRALQLSQIPVCVSLLRLLLDPDSLANSLAQTGSPTVANSYAGEETGANREETPKRSASDDEFVGYGSQQALSLLSSPLCNMDMLQLFRTLRRLQQFDSSIQKEDQDVVFWLEHPELLDELPGGLRREIAVQSLQQAAQIWNERETAAKESPQQGLWRLWNLSGRAELWRKQALAGGWEGNLADERLDAVIALFRKADLWEQQQLAIDPQRKVTAREFAQSLMEETIVSDSIATIGLREPGVEVLTAAQAAGRQWETVFISGLQDGQWPTVARAGSILHLAKFNNLISEIHSLSIDSESPASVHSNMHDLVDISAVDLRTYRQEKRKDEARLLVSAISRCRKHLHFVAVEDEDQAISPFLNYLERQQSVLPFHDGQALRITRETDTFDLPSLIGQLRQQTISPQADAKQRRAAASLLAVMAVEGIAQANPSTWIGAGGISSTAPILESGSVLSINPSSLQTATDCLLQWFLRAIHGDDYEGVLNPVVANAAAIGTMIHRLAEQFPYGPTEKLQEEFDSQWDSLGIDAQTWWGQRKKEELQQMVVRLGDYLQGDHGSVSVEVPFQVTVGESTVRGRIDRLEHGPNGVRIVDVKTSGSSFTKKEVVENLQLKVYQLAQLDSDVEVDGAALLTVGAPSKREGIVRVQDRLSEDEVEQLKKELAELSSRMVSQNYSPTLGNQCRFCRFKGICPAQDTGQRGIE